MEEPRGPSLREASEHVRSDVAALRGAAERERDELLGRVRSIVDEHPFGAMGVAAGLGYALSGALVSHTTLRIAALGARFYLGRAMKERAAAAAGTSNLGGPAR